MNSPIPSDGVMDPPQSDLRRCPQHSGFAAALAEWLVSHYRAGISYWHLSDGHLQRDKAVEKSNVLTKITQGLGLSMC